MPIFIYIGNPSMQTEKSTPFYFYGLQNNGGLKSNI